MRRKKTQFSIVRDLPHLYELGDIFEFCQKYENIYILGAAINQEYMLKFLDSCGIINVKGYAVTNPQVQNLQIWREIPIVAVDEILDIPSTGIIMGLADRYYSDFIPKFRKKGFSDYYIPTEYTKITLADQLKPKQRDQMVFEYQLTEHCNLSCQACDHFSQLADEKFVDIEIFERDMTRLADLFEHKVASVFLVGGEPLLHPDLIKCIKVTRYLFPEATIEILTNGLRLKAWENSERGNLWRTLSDYNVGIIMTLYPIGIDINPLEDLAQKYGVNFFVSSNIHTYEEDHRNKISDKHTIKLDGSAPTWGYVSCFFHNCCNNVKDGIWSLCPRAANIGIFNKKFNKNLEKTDNDYVDIYKVESWQELANFSANRIPLCSYCDIENWVIGHSDWKPSSISIIEYINELEV